MLVVGDAVWAATPKPIFGLRDGLGHDAGFSEVLLESRGRGETRVVVGAWITYGHPDLGLQLCSLASDGTAPAEGAALTAANALWGFTIPRDPVTGAANEPRLGIAKDAIRHLRAFAERPDSWPTAEWRIDGRACMASLIRFAGAWAGFAMIGGRPSSPSPRNPSPPSSTSSP